MKKIHEIIESGGLEYVENLWNQRFRGSKTEYSQNIFRKWVSKLGQRKEITWNQQNWEEGIQVRRNDAYSIFQFYVKSVLEALHIVEKRRNSLTEKNISWNQLFSNFWKIDLLRSQIFLAKNSSNRSLVNQIICSMEKLREIEVLIRCLWM